MYLAYLYYTQKIIFLNWCGNFFFYKFFHVKTSFSIYKTPLGETGCLSIYLFFNFFFFECSGIQFFTLPTCDLQDTMPCQRSLPLLPREAEGFPRGDRHFKHVPLLTYLIYLSPKELFVLGLFKHYSYQKMHYQNIGAHQNCYLKKYIQNIGAYQNCSLKKYITKLLSLNFFIIIWVYTQ